MNTEYEPTGDDEAILETLAGEPCGRANPHLLRQETELSKQRVNHSLKQLVAAGWISKRTRALYDLVADVDTDLERDTGETDSAPTEVRERAVEEADSELLADWEPQTDANAARAREETQRVVAWFRETGGRHTKAEIIESVGPEEGTDYWWRAVVRPGLGELAERGVVEYRAGHHDYKAVV